MRCCVFYSFCALPFAYSYSRTLRELPFAISSVSDAIGLNPSLLVARPSAIGISSRRFFDEYYTSLDRCEESTQDYNLKVDLIQYSCSRLHCMLLKYT